MRAIDGQKLWIGCRGDLLDMRRVRSAGIGAVVDLALNEEPFTVARETTLCRFPLVDGPGNSPAILRAAVVCVAELLKARVSTLVMCGAGMSRAPSIAAAALAMASGEDPQACLARITRDAPADVSMALWNDVLGAMCGSATGFTPDTLA